jgi:hypothetical protein
MAFKFHEPRARADSRVRIQVDDAHKGE